jgi:asparagine synthase (glutamine-hydrolysing)
MCGIAGIATPDGSAPPEPALDAMAKALGHRGPDGTGRYEAPGLKMAQTRLAIIDLKTGDQPLYGPSGTALIANGEIYNYLELRRVYGEERFVTASDCEVPLHAFARDGRVFTRDLRGMYAIALSDGRNERLELARDPFGIKPLYYAQTSAGLAFASEPQAIIQAGLVKPAALPEKARELLQLQFCTGRQTIFAGIERVLPGETLEIQHGRIVGRQLRRALPEGAPRRLSEAEALRELDAALMDSVALHQRSDVPYGMFLSGGVDSSALLTVMARLNERPVRAFTAGFPDSAARDERRHAQRVAHAAGAEHVAIEVTAEDFRQHLPAIVAAMDDPAADYAIVPSWLLAREAAKELKVVLCGEGGDELFAGYGRYRTVLRPRLFGGRPMRRRGALDGLGILRDESMRWRDGIAAAEAEARSHDWNRLQAVQAVDIADWLPHDLLLKLDRCLMAHGLEGRTPFLDSVVADLAFRLPDKLKIANGQGKYLLRRWLDAAMPEAGAFSPKRGFQVPVGEWIAGQADELAPLVAGNAGIGAICRPDEVARLFRTFAGASDKRQGAACWHLLFYALWHRIHIEGAAAHGDIAATLES